MRGACLLVTVLACAAAVYALPSRLVNGVDPNDIEVVHMVVMNHLDLGFAIHHQNGTESNVVGYCVNVINTYFQQFFPLALNVSATLARDPQGPQLIYTSHSWLVWLYLNCDSSLIPSVGDASLWCPSAADVAAFRQGIQRGWIAWHAFPFNGEPEIADAGLFAAGVDISARLNAEFNIRAGPTLTMSQRDVPGMTRGVVPLLVAAGVEAISVGVNSGSAPPDVPRIFRWLDNATDTSVIALYHPGGYGGINASDCFTFPGLTHALAAAIRGDNSGPPTVSEVLDAVAQLQQEFPNSRVVASTWDDFVEVLLPLKSQLPVVSQEIGDTWVYGCSSDSIKLAKMRAAMRLRSACTNTQKCSTQTPTFIQFDFLLLKTIEHTWGLDMKTWLSDFENYTNAEFESARNQLNYQRMQASWAEQAAYLTQAVGVLSSSPVVGEQQLAAQIEAEWALIDVAGGFNATGLTPITLHSSTVFKCSSQLSFSLSPSTGAITQLLVDGVSWADSEHPLALAKYQTLSNVDDYDFFDAYAYCLNETVCGWVPDLDFIKYNLSSAQARSSVSEPAVKAAYTSTADGVVVRLAFFPDASQLAGAAADMWLIYKCVGSSQLDVSLISVDKTPTRLPEAMYLSFQPAITANWTMQKLGLTIDMADEAIVRNGSQHIHAVEAVSTTASSGSGTLRITPLDTPIMSAGVLSTFPTPLAPLNLPAIMYADGVHFNIWNNLWGTNYVLWQNFTMLASRYQLQFN